MVATWTELPTPADMVQHLDRLVHGQQRAKRDLANCVYKHYMGAAYRNQQPHLRNPFGKRHMLLLGPTGAGKTYLVSSLAAYLGVPLAFASAASLVEAGYVGEHIDTVFRRLLVLAGGNARLAERGIIFIDEIDKVRRQDVGGQRDVSGEGVQTSLLAPLDGCPIEMHLGDRAGLLDSSNVLFICAGAFVGLADIVRHRLGAGCTLGFRQGADDPTALTDEEALARGELVDLQTFGFIPEFVGRFAVISTVQPLTRDDLTAILTQVDESPLKRVRRWFEQHGVRLTFADDALDALAEKALKSGTNARALDRLLAKTLGPIEWQLPELALRGVREVVMTRDAVLGGGAAELRQGKSTVSADPQKLRRDAAQLIGSFAANNENAPATPSAPSTMPPPARRDGDSPGSGRSPARRCRGKTRATRASACRQLNLPFAEPR